MGRSRIGRMGVRVGGRSLVRVSVAAMLVMGVLSAREAAAVERRGFTAGVSAGAGHMGCDGCDPGSMAVAFHAGWTPRSRVALVLDFTSLSHYVGEDSSYSTSYGLVGARTFVGKKAWVEAGIGGGSTEVESGRVRVASEGGFAYGAAAGLELVQKKKSALDLSARGGSFVDEGTRVTNLSVHVGWSWY